ncbi:hypothetical protein ACFPT7_02040 [Acidicapsa dinghuensis]|uniref:Helix-turn-helix domain-containing protein n=1 Tax=Acidicapsa dinghuensis TaxID=2218256 RepID=A0ABW1E9X6_9BACT|nr:hypothetical protein [Acidicapsa dinghuensis]
MPDALMDFDENEPAPVFADRARLDLASDDVPPAGTACVPCRSMGHWCAAKCYRGSDEPICRACANGVDCDVVRAKLRGIEKDLMEELGPVRPDHPVAPVRRIPIDPAHRVVKEAAPVRRLPYEPMPGAVSTPKAKPRIERHGQNVLSKASPTTPDEFTEECVKQPTFLTDEQLEAIRIAPASETTAALARRLGINEPACWYQRDKFRQQRAAVKAGYLTPKAASKPSKSATKLPKAAQAPVALTAAPAPRPAPTPEDAQCIEIAVRFTPLGVDAWWSTLSLAAKAKIVAANLVI